MGRVVVFLEASKNDVSGIVCRYAKELRRYPKLTMIQLRAKIIAVIRINGFGLQ
jgi:hypothetical protein